MQHLQFGNSYPTAMTSLRNKILTSYGLSKAALLVFVAVVIADLYYLQTHIVEGEAVDDLPPVASQDTGEVIGIAIGDIVHVEHVGAGPGPTADDFRNALFLFAIGVMAVIAAFANF